MKRSTIAVVTFVAAFGLIPNHAMGAISFTGDVSFAQNTVVGNTTLGTLRIDGGSELSSNGATIGGQSSGVGFVTVSGAGSRWSFPTSGQLDVGNSGLGRLEIVEGGVVSLGFGQVRIAVNSTSHGTVIVDGPGSVLNSNSQITVGSTPNGGSALLRIANGAIVNTGTNQLQTSLQGRVELDNGLLRVNQFANNGTIIGSGEVMTQSTSNMISSGRIEVGEGGLLKFTGPGEVIQNQGIIAVDGGEIEFSRGLLNTIAGQSVAEITLRGGTLRAGKLIPGGSQLVNSAVLAATGGVNDLYGRLTNQGEGHIAATNHSVMIFHDDVTANNGTITVFPGSSAVFLKDLTVGADAVLSANLAGTNDNTGFGTIEVVGNADLAGALEVTLAGGFTPSAGSTFSLLAAGGINGALSLGDTPPLPAALAWDLDVDAHRVVLSVVPALEGDFNANGVVDAADYIVWRRTLGGMGYGLVADGNHDNKVDDDDYAVWRANFGATADSGGGASIGAATVPEPATLGLLLMAVVAVAWRPVRHAPAHG